jgi:long-chain acyl-CoA synthetase
LLEEYYLPSFEFQQINEDWQQMAHGRKTLLSYLDEYRGRGDEIAFVQTEGWRRVRWSSLRVVETAALWAKRLAACQVAKGDRVLLWAENSADWVAAFYGCLLRGAVVVPLDAQSAPGFVDRVQQEVKANLLLLSHKFQAQPYPAGVRRLLLEELNATQQHVSSVVPEATIHPDDLVEIVFTSGTTADPRGVCLTHRNLLANLNPLEAEIQKYLKWERWFHPVRFLNLVPLSHVFGQFMGIFLPHLLGGEVHFHVSLNPSGIIETAKTNRISALVAVPRLLDTLREKLEQEIAVTERLLVAEVNNPDQMSFLRRVWAFRHIHQRFGWKFWAFISGGATLSQETEAFWRRLGFAVVQGYGMTETAALISVAHPFRLQPRSIGKALPGREIKLAENGEVLVRGENVAAGIWSSGLKPLTDPEGWLHTGDLAQQDKQGHLFFRGRQKDVIVTAAGVNIYPEDLEAALNRQPDIRASAVIGLEGVSGPEPVAILILRSQIADAATAIEHANRELGPLQRVRRWMVWPEAEFPRTTTQKIQKPAIAQWANAQLALGKGATSALPIQGELKTLVSMVSRITGTVPERTDRAARLDVDLKVDSVGRVELLSALEDHYQIEMDEATVTAATTLGEIEDLVCGQLAKTFSAGAAPSKPAGPQAPAATTSSSRGDNHLPARESVAGLEPRQTSESSTISQAPFASRTFTRLPYPYPRWAMSKPLNWLRSLFLYGCALPITRLLCRVRVRGREHVTALQGPLLITANHVTYLDPGLVLFALPGQLKRRLAIAMDGERLRRWRYPPETDSGLYRLAWQISYLLVACLFNVFSLPQNGSFRRSFSYAGEALDRGYSVLVFPEGRLTDDGRLNAFRPGIGLLAAGLYVPILPVRLDGLFALRQSWGSLKFPWFRRGDIVVTFGRPIQLSWDEDPPSVTHLLERAIRDLEQGNGE